MEDKEAKGGARTGVSQTVVTGQISESPRCTTRNSWRVKLK